jgi:Arc/MetJ-type ribon-helix-helix transcriptional regulator
MAHQKKEMETLNIRIPSTLKELIERYVALDCHVNISDFARDAIREKIKRDAPQFYKQIFREEEIIQ